MKSKGIFPILQNKRDPSTFERERVENAKENTLQKQRERFKWFSTKAFFLSSTLMKVAFGKRIL